MKTILGQNFVVFPYPFNFQDVGIVLERCAMARKWCYEMLQLGYTSVCPLLVHNLLTTLGDPSLCEDSWNDVKPWFLKQMDSCDLVQVLMFKGYEDSITVQDTILHAKLTNKTLVFVNTTALEDYYRSRENPPDSFWGRHLGGRDVPVPVVEDGTVESGGTRDCELRDAEPVDSGC